MPVNLNRKMQAFEGVGAGQTATARLPVGLRFHNVMFAYSGVTLAQMTEIRIIANGKVIQRLIGADVLDSINRFDGRNSAAGIITIDFERFGLRTRSGSELTVIDTTAKKQGDPNKITTLSIEVDIDGAALSPVLGVPKAKQSGAISNPSNVMKHIRVFGYDPAGSGEFQISDLPKIGAINRIFLKSAATINSIKVERNGYVISDLDKAENEVNQADGVRVPQAGYYVVDFTEGGNGQDWLEVAGVQDFRLSLDMAAAGHIDVLVEYLHTLNG
ncbi:MAG: hypothetical protein COA83_09880 [Methylophaga sp.]|nr:MAG: hypothetical protein COA83_09880 [Methylophaga sp.]